MNVTNTDAIEKTVTLRAPRSRVWRAITNARSSASGSASSSRAASPRAPSTRGRITYPGYEHLTMEMQVERIEPERYFAYRWHPYAVDPDVDFSSEPTTLVEFRLEEADGGTVLTIVESGFDRIPAGAPRRSVPHERRRVDRTDEEHRAPCLATVARRRRN